MYTLVLATMLTTGTQVPDWGCRGGCRGCCGGCYGCGGGCWGCYGCGGCWGGCYGCGGGCYGCWGGCWGGCYGCWGGCYGCGGGCWGCYGCGGGMVIMSGCCGGIAAVGSGAAGGGGGRGSGGSSPQGGGGGSASPGGGGGSGATATSLEDLKKSVDELQKGQSQMRIDALKITADELRRKETDQKVDELRREINDMRRRTPPPPPPAPGAPPPKLRRELPNPQPGKVFLEMPAEAVVFVNDTRIESASSYLTQPLEPSKEYVLNIEAVLAQNGQSVNRAKQVTIRAGEEVRLAYRDMDLADGRGSTQAGSAAATARITVRLPADAQLSVHGVDCPLTSDTRTFETPALASGQKYYYLLRAEVVRDGRTIAQTKRIDFRSGERVTISFDDLGANAVTAR